MFTESRFTKKLNSLKSQAAMEFLMYKTESFMPRKSKSQAAMEFLMTYGWALLVVLMVIIGLNYYGALDVKRFLPDKISVSSNNIDIVSAVVTKNSVEFIIMNKGTNYITNANITIANCEDTGYAESTFEIAPGKSHNIDVHCTGHELDTRFNSNFTITYDVYVGEFTTNKQDRGKIDSVVDKFYSDTYDLCGAANAKIFMGQPPIQLLCRADSSNSSAVSGTSTFEWDCQHPTSLATDSCTASNSIRHIGQRSSYDFLMFSAGNNIVIDSNQGEMWSLLDTTTGSYTSLPRQSCNEYAWDGYFHKYFFYENYFYEVGRDIRKIDTNLNVVATYQPLDLDRSYSCGTGFGCGAKDAVILGSTLYFQCDDDSWTFINSSDNLEYYGLSAPGGSTSAFAGTVKIQPQTSSIVVGDKTLTINGTDIVDQDNNVIISFVGRFDYTEGTPTGFMTYNGVQFAVGDDIDYGTENATAYIILSS